LNVVQFERGSKFVKPSNIDSYNCNSHGCWVGRNLEALLGVVNGAVGDYLHRTSNGLATPMEWVRGRPGKRTVVLVHGLMCTEDVWTMPDGTDYGALLERDFGFSPLYVRYNTGRPIGDNGRELARLLEELVQAHPAIEELVLLGFSMGGLLIRSATHFAREMRWLTLVQRAFYVGTPHLGSPWERLGRGLTRLLREIPDPYTRLAADLGDLRSTGIKDLGDRCHPYPLLPQIRHYLVAGSVSANPQLSELLGDALVPVPSGCNGALPAEHVKVLPGIAHLTLARHPAVYAQLRAWCEEPS
jgi:pimeloyl-ACP methyl ester carboxylesterase